MKYVAGPAPPRARELTPGRLVGGLSTGSSIVEAVIAWPCP